MTNERETVDDKRVSDTYRELATETTPQHLNDAVLEMAAGRGTKATRSDGLFKLWMKPVALAATIGLSLAIVLQVGQNSVLTPESTAVLSPQSMEEAFTPKDADVIDAAEDRARLQAGSPSSDDSDASKGRTDQSLNQALVAESTIADDRPAEQAIAEVELDRNEEKRHSESFSAAAGAGGTSAKKELTAAVVNRPGPEPEQELALDEFTAARSASDSEASSMPIDDQPSLAAGANIVLDSLAICDEPDKQTIDDWRSCIEKLRLAGEDKLADLESEAFMEKYPQEILEPDTNK